MALFDAFAAKQDHPYFGPLIYRQRQWQGELSLKPMFAEPIPFMIDADEFADLTLFQSIVDAINAKQTTLAADIQAEAFETYTIYKREDLRIGNFVEADYLNYPLVNSASDIWAVLQPTELVISPNFQHGDAILRLDVAWPNPHVFAVTIDDGD